jgi:hypothetical protein
MKSLAVGLFLNVIVLTNAFADNILLIRGLDQVVFRGMDVLGAELRRDGHTVNVSAPILAMEDFTNYDVVIGNSQGAVVAMNRKQRIKPRLVITIDIPPHPNWRATTGVRHLNVHGPFWGTIKGARNVFMPRGHLGLSFSSDMRQMVHRAVNVW